MVKVSKLKAAVHGTSTAGIYKFIKYKAILSTGMEELDIAWRITKETNKKPDANVRIVLLALLWMEDKGLSEAEVRFLLSQVLDMICLNWSS